MNAPYPSAAQPGRPHEFSPASTDTGSGWSGMNNYNASARPDANYNGQMGYPRHDRDYSPDSAGYHGPPPPRTFVPQGMEGPHRPRRPSETGSRQSSGAGSVANSRSSDGTISDQQSRKYRKMEMELQQHYTILKNYLKGGAPQPPRPNKARDKLLRLSPLQFHELSTDVFDELQRRQAAAPLPGRGPRRDNVPPFLQPRPEFHEKRNQARQKLSSLQASRFRDLSTDVFCELERRFPHFGMPDGRRRDSTRSTSSRGGRGPPPRVNTANLPPSGLNGFPPRQGSVNSRDAPPYDNTPTSAGSMGGDFGRPIPKQFQSHVITPNKSTMVEDDEDDGDTGFGRSSDAYGRERSLGSPGSDGDTPATSVTNLSRDTKSLHDRISGLESNLKNKDDDLANLRTELDKKVADAEKLQQALQDELEKLKTQHSARERDFETQLSAAKRSSESDEIWKTKHDELRRNHGELQTRLDEQQRITDEVGRRGEQFLKEMRAMAEEQDSGTFEREDKLQSEVVRLREELIEWKNRYNQARTQTKANNISTINGMKPMIKGQTTEEDLFRHRDGMIAETHVSKFQFAIDDLLVAARNQDPTDVMDVLKAVVVAVRNIALDIDAAPALSKDDENFKKRAKLKERMAATANNLITACRSHAASSGISPLSLLDAAASHLSAAVVELARTVKIRPVQASDNTEEDILPVPEGTPDPMNGAGYFTMSQRLRNDSPVNSIYSALSAPGEHGAGGSDGSEDKNYSRDSSATRNGLGSTGLGIQAGLRLKEDDTELQELKIYIENQTDLLVQNIQALVSSIRHEEHMPSIQAHISSILDIVDNVLSHTEGAMDEASWFQGVLKECATPALNSLALSREKLVETANDPQAHLDGPASKSFTQKLPPLAFRLARDTKDLVSRLENMETRSQTGMHDHDEDFS